jgi:altronate hydrolase
MLDSGAQRGFNATGSQTGADPMPGDPAAATLAALRVAPGDDVAIALRDLEAGESVYVDGAEIVLAARVGRGHKFALRGMGTGELVHRYGFAIGRVTAPIERGDWVHAHNLATRLAGVDSEAAATPVAATPLSRLPVDAGAATFLGYRRDDGRVGTRNEIWVLCSVGCVANTARRLAELAARRHHGRVDGVHAFTHVFGCSQLGDDLANTGRIIAALANHPNVGGALLVGLGCESLQLKQLLDASGTNSRLRWFNSQDVADEIEAGMAELDALVQIAAQDRRVPCALSDLVVGLKCGGSDGFSGVSANPLVGRIADLVNGAGGTTILSEIPEMFGAEHLLMQRAADPGIAAGIDELVRRFKRYFVDRGEPVSENPSPGNIAGGITTLEEKSLGAVQKGGSAAVTQVLRYGERVHAPGLAILEAPGNDAVSSTALVAAGATVLLFTTGRGTPLGFPVPTLKIASNSALANAKPRWIDFDAGGVLAGEDPGTAASRLLDLLLRTASGAPARNELNDERQIALWKTGVTL